MLYEIEECIYTFESVASVLKGCSKYFYIACDHGLKLLMALKVCLHLWVFTNAFSSAFLYG